MNQSRVKQLLKKSDLETLFVEELGWDRYGGALSIELGGKSRKLEGIAQKRGMRVFRYAVHKSESIADYPLRKRVEREVAKYAHEHLIIFVDDIQRIQVWQWVKREPGRSPEYREHHFMETTEDERLQRKLEAISFEIDDEEELSIVEVVESVCSGFHDDYVMDEDIDVALVRRNGVQKSYCSPRHIVSHFRKIAKQYGYSDKELCSLSYRGLLPHCHWLLACIEDFVEGQAGNDLERYEAKEVSRILSAIRSCGSAGLIRRALEQGIPLGSHTPVRTEIPSTPGSPKFSK